MYPCCAVSDGAVAVDSFVHRTIVIAPANVHPADQMQSRTVRAAVIAQVNAPVTRQSSIVNALEVPVTSSVPVKNVLRNVDAADEVFPIVHPIADIEVAAVLVPVTVVSKSVCVDTTIPPVTLHSVRLIVAAPPCAITVAAPVNAQLYAETIALADSVTAAEAPPATEIFRRMTGAVVVVTDIGPVIVTFEALLNPIKSTGLLIVSVSV